MCIFATDMRKLLYISVFFLLLASCTDDKEVMPVLERAEAYLPEHPDSAGMLLDSISSRPLGDSGERVRSLYGLLRTMTDAMTGKGVTTDSLIRPAYIYYKEQGESDENTRRLGRSAFYLARFEASRDSTKRAEDLYREAIRCSEQVEDWRTCYMAYDHFAKSITWSNTELAIQLRKQAIDIYNRCKDKPANYISLLNSLSNDYLSVGFADSAFHCTEEAYQIACDYQLDDMQYASLRTLSNLYYETGNYQKALELVKQGLHGLTDQTREASLFSLADCYLACDSLEQAKTIFLSISSSDNKMRYTVFRKLSQIAIQQHDTPSAIAYSDSTYQAVVNIFSESQHQKDLYYNNLLDEELANERLSHHNQTLLYSFIIIFLGLVILVLVSYRKIRRYINRLKEKYKRRLLSSETLISEYQIRINQINEQVAQNEHTLKQYQQLLEQKQNELQHLKRQDTSTEEFKIRQQQYEQEISVLKQLYLNEKEKRQKIASESQQVITRLQQYTIGQSDLYKQIVSDKIRIHQIDDHDWRYVEYLLDSCSDRFACRLKKKFPRLTDEQYHLCLLSRMGLNRKQVASFMCLAEVTIKKKHQECKRTVFDISDPQSSFNDIIARF